MQPMTREGRQLRCDAGVCMNLTGGTRATATTAGTILLGGLSLTLYGAVRNDFARSLSGTCLTITALTVVAVVMPG